MERSADIGIVGAGPAGARAAELLAGQGANVLLLDPNAANRKAMDALETSLMGFLGRKVAPTGSGRGRHATEEDAAARTSPRRSGQVEIGRVDGTRCAARHEGGGEAGMKASSCAYGRPSTIPALVSDLREMKLSSSCLHRRFTGRTVDFFPGGRNQADAAVLHHGTRKMFTMRALSVALALAVVGVGPSAAQQPQHLEGLEHPTGDRTPEMTTDHGMCMMHAMQREPALKPRGEAGGQLDHVVLPQIADPAATGERVPRARRAWGPGRIGAAAAASRTTRVEGARHADRERVRLFTGPTRFPPAIVAWHDVDPTGGADSGRARPPRRATGPSRIVHR